jgi:hypothetical protein
MAPPIPSAFFTRGDTFSWAGFATLPSDDPWEATSELRDQQGNLVQELTVTLQAPTTPETTWPILLWASAADTTDWPLGPLNCDIRFVYSINVIHSARFVVNVTNEITTSQPTLYV